VHTLVQETALGERAVAQHLDALERQGLIRRERRHVTQGPAKGRRMSDLIFLVPTPANVAGDQTAQSAGDVDTITRKSRKVNPQNSPGSPANSSSAHIRIEPSKEPSVEPSRLADDDDEEENADEIRRMRDDPKTRHAAELIYETLGIQVTSPKQVRSVARGIVELVGSQGLRFGEHVLPAVRAVTNKLGHPPGGPNCTWLTTTVAPVAHAYRDAQNRARR
jgi:hypothetical protein